MLRSPISEQYLLQFNNLNLQQTHFIPYEVKITETSLFSYCVSVNIVSSISLPPLDHMSRRTQQKILFWMYWTPLGVAAAKWNLPKIAPCNQYLDTPLRMLWDCHKASDFITPQWMWLQQVILIPSKIILQTWKSSLPPGIEEFVGRALQTCNI